MRKYLFKMIKIKQNRWIVILLPFLILFIVLSFYSIVQPSTTVKQTNENTAQLETDYSYQATVNKSLLYPTGGTIEAGDILFKKITAAIPLYLKATINSEDEVTVKGTLEVNLLLKAGERWEKSFPLEKQQSFEKVGTDVNILDKGYKIDLQNLNNFITQVEEEVGSSPGSYTYEIVPKISGTINHNGVEKDFQMGDKLIFEAAYDEIKLASEKTFTSQIPFTKTETITNTFNLFGLSLPLVPVRIISTILAIILLIPILFNYKQLMKTRVKPKKSEVFMINKKYGKRIITVTQELKGAQKSIISLDSFKSILHLSDEKELPIFLNKKPEEGRPVFFIVDGDYVYSYESASRELVRNSRKDPAISNVYAES